MFIFKKTVGKTVKENNAVKINNKNILDYNYITEQIDNIDISKVENLFFSRGAIIERFKEAMKEQKYITEAETGFIYVDLNINSFKVVIESTINHYAIYDAEGYKRLYLYHYANNCRITIYDSTSNYPVYTNMFNKVGFGNMSRYYHENVRED